MDERWVAVLGQPDTPVDAVEEYCRYLASALAAHGTTLEVARLPWAEEGLSGGLKSFSGKFPSQKTSWFLLQYTALAWSRRGFSWRFLTVIRHLKRNGARCAVVFHDAETYFGSRLVDRVRRAVQLHVMREAWRLADLSIFTIPPAKIPWLPSPQEKTAFIPVGANLPAPERAWPKGNEKDEGLPTVAVFSLSDGLVGEKEVKSIADALLFAAQGIGRMRVLVLGRNSEMARTSLQERMGAAPVGVVVRGLLPPDEVVQLLGTCDVMLFVRGPISTRRGSAIAGIACGLPVVGDEGWETAAPITEAGVALIDPGETRGFGPALLRVLSDDAFRMQLADRSKRAYERYFSWEAIAAQFAEAMSRYQHKP
jgi:glycosyltransferase involved in cell wall biosynthesis